MYPRLSAPIFRPISPMLMAFAIRPVSYTHLDVYKRQTEPYENGEEGYRGYPIYTDEQVESFVRDALRENRQLLAHCNGDAAAQQYIDAFETVLGGLRPVDTRPVMIHAQLLRRDQLPAMRTLGMISSFFVAHTYYWGDVHVRNFGLSRASGISPRCV